MKIRPFALVSTVVLVCGSGLAQQSRAQEPADVDEQNVEDEQNLMEFENCINLTRVDRTDVVDDDTILFYMRDGDIYQNNLPHSCPGLAFEERFMYRVTLHQLCAVDVITVIDDLGFGFMPGASCGLGKFEPITQATADEILRMAEQEDQR